jgi:hypothetical protein
MIWHKRSMINLINDGHWHKNAVLIECFVLLA